MWGHRRWQCYACSAECQQQYSQQGDPEHLPIPCEPVAVTGLPLLVHAWHVSPSNPRHPSCESAKAPPPHHDRRHFYSWKMPKPTTENALSDTTTLSCQKTNCLLSFMRLVATSSPGWVETCTGLHQNPYS